RRRSASLLPGASHGRSHLQSLLLVPGGAPDVRCPLRLRSVDDQARSADAAHSPLLVPVPHAVRRAQTHAARDRGSRMLKMARILRDYEEAGSVNSLLALWGFVDDHTFLTKAGHVGLVYRMGGLDYECLDQAQRRDIVHRFEAALRLLDESCRVYQYLCK